MLRGPSRLCVFSILALTCSLAARCEAARHGGMVQSINHTLDSDRSIAEPELQKQPGHDTSNSVTGRSLASVSGNADSTPSTSRIFLIQRGHVLTSRLVAQAVLAKTQILAAGGAYHFMFKSAHQRDPLQPSTATSLSLALLRDALGADHVSHIMAKDIVEQFPGLVEWSSDYGLGGYERTSSDVFDYALYSRFKSDGTLPSWATKVWLMEWDVAWTGNLADILTRHFNPHSSFIGYDTINATALLTGDKCLKKKCEVWQHTKMRTWPPKDTDVFRSQAMLLRLDVRLLDSLVTHYEHKEWLFNESAGATVCISGESSWCKVDWTFMPGHPALGRHPGTNLSMYYWNYRMNDSQWVQTLQKFEDKKAKDPDALGQLYHALKW